MTEHSDTILLRAFTNGNDDALCTLASQYERAMLGMAAGLVDDHEIAKDAVQETWVRVIRFASGFKDHSSVKTWLYRILINVCADAREKKKATGAPKERSAATAAPIGGIDRGVVRDAVERLDWDRRVILLLCYHRGMTHEHAADALGLPLGTLKSRLHAALEELRRSVPQEVCHD